MKKLLTIAVLAIIVIACGIQNVSAQKYIHTWATADTIKGNVYRYYPATAGYDMGATSTGSVLFQFTKTDKTDSLNYARFEYLDQFGGTWTAMTGTAALVNTTTDGTTVLYTSTPLLHKYYRAILHCVAGDTVKITNATLLIKDK
jgi:hypothetical protein